MNTAISAGTLMGLATKFAAELETLSEQAKQKKVNISAKVESTLADTLTKGKIATGASESSIIEECIKHSLQYVIREFIRRREEAEREFEAIPVPMVKRTNSAEKQKSSEGLGAVVPQRKTRPSEKH
jgi:hypothetical protein